jgi:AbrB family looped-hinge helix DNA binding protein
LGGSSCFAGGLALQSRKDGIPYVTTAKITTKGQVTIPKDIRDELGVDAGDVIDFVRQDGTVRVYKVLAEDPFEEYRRYFKDLAGQDVDELIDEWRGR